MGKAGKIIGGIVLIAGGVVAGVTGNWGLAVALASMGIGMISSPRNLAARQGTILQNRAGADQCLPVIYGTTKVAGVLADLRVDAASMQRKRLVVVTAFAHGSQNGSGVNGIDQVWFDDQLAIAGTVTQPPFNKVIPKIPLMPSSGLHYLEYEHHLGSSTQTVDTRLQALFPSEWSSDARGRGVCYSRFELWYDTDVFSGGLPNIMARIQGNSVYDPRDSTWKFSTNPVLCIRDYLTSPVYGLNIAEENLDESSFIDMANYCDELVTDGAGGTQKRYEINGWLDTSRSVEQNLIELCASCRGQVVNEGDQWRMLIRRARGVSGIQITDENTVEGTWQYVLAGAANAPNLGRATYVDPTRNYATETVQWPEPGAPNAYLDDDNGYEQLFEMDLPLTDNRVRAQQIVMTGIKESRKGISCTVTLQEDMVEARVGDLVEVTKDTPGWVAKQFDVGALLLQEDGSVQAIMMEYDPEVYDVDNTLPQPETFDTNLPNAFAISAPTSLVLTSLNQALQTNDGRYTPRIRATWGQADDPFVDYYEVQARKSFSTDVVDPGATPFDSSAFTQFGLGGFDATKVWNGVTTGETAWQTDAAATASWVQLDCGDGVTREFVQCRIYALLAGYTGVYSVQYLDGVTWVDAATGFTPALAGENIIQWATVGAHRFWRIVLTTASGAGPDLAELQFYEASWDSFGRVSAVDAPLCYVYPVTDESWDVRIRAVNTIGRKSDWVVGTCLVVTEDPRPQILSITSFNNHTDTHTDNHSDVGHADSLHVDSHSDIAHTDYHFDSHDDVLAHSDTSHSDSHDDVHGDGDLHIDSHIDHSDTTNSSHFDVHGDEHDDTVHTDAHTDTAHGDSVHSDNHVDAHSDAQHGLNVALQADKDSASIRVVARVHGDHTDGAHADVTDPTEAEVRGQLAYNGRNVVVELIDVATGAAVGMNPGDQVTIGALAYSEDDGGGVEGPLALGKAGLFNVAPVGVDKWVPG